MATCPKGQAPLGRQLLQLTLITAIKAIILRHCGRLRNEFVFRAIKSLQINTKVNSQEDRGHQSSGARAPELWCPHIFFSGFSWWCSHIYAGSVPIKPGNVRNTKIHLGKNRNWYSWSPFLRLKQKTCFQLERAPEFWCPSSWKQVFCFNLKNGHQEYQFFFFPKCIFVLLTFPGFIGILPA